MWVLVSFNSEDNVLCQEIEPSILTENLNRGKFLTEKN